MFLTALILLLWKKVLLCFDADSEGKISSPRGSQLVHMTLMMHSWVVPSQMFAQKLLTLYPWLSLSALLWSLWSTAANHMFMFINQIRKQAWLCFALLVYKADLKYIYCLQVFSVMLCHICTVCFDPWLFLSLTRIVPQTKENWGGHRSAPLLGE